MDVSIVVPAYNEENRLGESLDLIIKFMDTLKLKYEIIVVDDGSTDSTVDVALKRNKVKIIKNNVNSGKGFSIKRGFSKAKGGLVLFTDSDLSTPISEFIKLKDEIEKGVDLAIGSRNLDNSNVLVKQALYRRLLGKLFPLIVDLFILKGIKDTQCGFKLYSKALVEEIVVKQKINRFAFDVEHIYIAKKLGFKIAEVPVIWVDKEGTKVNPIYDGFFMLIDLFKIRFSKY